MKDLTSLGLGPVIFDLTAAATIDKYVPLIADNISLVSNFLSGRSFDQAGGSEENSSHCCFEWSGTTPSRCGGEMRPP